MRRENSLGLQRKGYRFYSESMEESLKDYEGQRGEKGLLTKCSNIVSSKGMGQS